MGSRGSQGYQGHQGYQGYTGFQGFQGYQGDIVNYGIVMNHNIKVVLQASTPADKTFGVLEQENLL